MPTLEIMEYADFKAELSKQPAIKHIRYAFGHGEAQSITLVLSVLVDPTTIMRYAEGVAAINAKERLEEIKKELKDLAFSAGLWSI